MVALLACGLCGLSAVSSAATFDEQRAAVAAGVETQPEEVILSLLQAGIAESKPTQAAALAGDWLRQNLPEDGRILYYAARNAELAGDWEGAAALYQQFLKQADPASAEAGEAITAVHGLLINHLNDAAAAYSFGRTAAASLSTNPRFRQWDRWFLDSARRSRDHEAVAGRLLATVQAGVPADQLTVLYEADFLWLLEAIREVRYDQEQDRFRAEFVAEVRELAKTLTFDEELALLLDWAVSVKAYNMARIDGKEAAAPLAVAQALLAKYPRHAERVQTDWAGGSNSPHYRDDPAKYWNHGAETKFAAILAAVPKLSPVAQADLFRTWAGGYYSRGPELFTVEEARAFVRGNPALVNSRIGPGLNLDWANLTPKDARELAPHLAQNASPEASMVRAVAAGGEEKDLNKAMDALLTTEAWRLGPSELNGGAADRLWHWAGRPDGNGKRDQEIARSKELLKGLPADEADPKRPAAQRLASFRELWKDYRSNQPKIPAVRSRLANLVRVTPAAVTELLRDPSVEAQLLVRDALARGLEDENGPLSGDGNVRGLSPDRYDPIFRRLFERHRRNVDYLQKQGLYKPHPLLPELERAVAQGMKKGELPSWLVMAWLNAQFPEDNAASVKLMEELFGSPAWKELPLEVRHGARDWFQEQAMSEAQFALVQAGEPEVIFADLAGLPEDADAATATAAVQEAIEAMRSAPVRVDIPEAALERLGALDPEVFGDDNLVEAVLTVFDQLKSAQAPVELGNRLITLAKEGRDPELIHRAAPLIWRQVNRYMRSFETVKQLTESLIDEHPSAASALALAALDAFARHRGHSYFDRGSDVPYFKSLRGRAAMEMGLVVIPVAKGHPAYPVYQSQAEWTTGNDDSAWDLLDEHWEAFLETHRELSIAYLMWTLERVTYGRDEARQETLIKALLGWANEAGSPLTLQEKARIEIAYGDIALQRGQLRQAHEIFTRIQGEEAYQELMIRHEATLRRAAAERLAKDFDGALQTLSELELERIPGLWTRIRYARAEVHFDMEEFEDARDDIETILVRDPNHADAKILLGKVQLKREKLMEATEVELGSASSRDSLVPGEKLKVTLNDPTLAVSGAGTEIEVVVWTTAGDREQFFLRQFGDQKTKFRGEVATALGAPEPGDDTLQVIGDDEVYYAYSERFREKMPQLGEKRGGPITVASDALLIASARKLLTEAEQRTADMEALMAEIEGRGAGGNVEGAARARMAARSLDAEARIEDRGISEDDFNRHLANVAKPGNPVHVRVIDPDRSRTAEIDELTVSVSTSSGDSIGRITLRETGTHTGWFEGSIPTTGAQAMAFARDSEPGRNPNMVISPNPDYPAWRPVLEDGEVAEFTIDLNDNVALGELALTAAEEGAKLKSFALQTGMNEGELTTVAVYPRNQAAIEKPWHPSVLVMNDTDHHHNRNERSVYDLHELQEHVERGWITQAYAAGNAGNVAGPSEAMTEAIPGEVKWLRQNRHHNAHVVYRFRAYFHEPREVTRRFKVELGSYKTPENMHPSVAHPPQFLLAVNGRPITDPEQPDRLEGEVNLRPGIHQFEIWATGWDGTIGFGRDVKLLANLGEPEGLVDCPDAFFDPATFPENSLDHRNAPATATASEGGDGFGVTFAPGSRARLLRLVLLDHEGTVPALNKISLTKPDGGRVLPVAEDFAALNKNETLEMLTGDRVSVRYVDDRFVTKTKETHERFLDVAFTNARVEFADMEPRWSEKHRKDMPYYEKLLRFRHDEPLALAIHDADMDVSGGPDTVPVTISSAAGGERSFEAVETGDSTGVFKLVVTPVPGQATGEQVQVAVGGTLTAAYLDEENNRPGVPTGRLGTIGHAAFAEPEILLSHATVTPWEPEEGTGMRSLVHGFESLHRRRSEDFERLASERVRARWEVANALQPSREAPEGGFAVVHGRHLHLELVAPHLALRTSSQVRVFAQTDAGRAAAGVAGNGGFDISVPGTIEVTGRLLSTAGSRDWHGIPEIPIYVGGGVWSHQEEPRTDRFRMSLPLVAGPLPPFGVLSEEEREELEKAARDSRSAARELAVRVDGLVARPGERIHLGFRYTGRDGTERWLTTAARVITHPVFDVMAEDYRSPMESAYVGETLNLRAVDLGGDVSDEMDTVTVLVQAKSGAKGYVELRESGPHTGIFKGEYLLTYAKEGVELAEDHDFRREGIPVIYGDTVASRYTDGNGVKSETHFVTISKGADGSISPFSKQYEDAETAMRTQFSLAEAYLEMAKRHRKLGETERAEREYASAKLLLSKAMDQFTDPETRAHAEYLLGTLTMEEAIAAEDEETRETRFRAALSRFMTVTGSYPQTLHASRAQYRIATVYEALKEPEIAAQEYVKLAYKYPDSEFLATSMARLGSHFLKKAASYEAQAKPLLARAEEDKDAAFEGQALQKMAEREYLKTASIFGRLQERFPGNELAGQAGLRAGQAFMRAGEEAKAVAAFQKVIAEESYDGPKVRAQAMYWVGMCYQDLRQEMAAYSTFKRLTYDFPESQWASYARGQLSTERLLRLENELELKRLEEGL